MKNRTKNNRNNGFTLVETLAVVAIIVILLGVSAVAVIRYINYQELTKLDNAAREIYMAAQNRAVLLSGNQQLPDMVHAKTEKVDEDGNPIIIEGPGTYVDLSWSKYHGGDGVYPAADDIGIVNLLATVDDGGIVDGVAVGEELYYVNVDEIQDGLLDTGNIDPTLLDGDFYIVYDRISGSVTDVVYAKDPGSLRALVEPETETESETEGSDKDNFTDYYYLWTKDHSERVNEKPLVGWYNGRAAGASTQPVSPDGQPVIVVDINNGEELTVTVSVYYGDVNKVTKKEVRDEIREVLNNGGLSVMLSDINGDNEGINLMSMLDDDEDGGRIRGDGFNTVDYKNSTSYSYTWVLDSLTAGEGEYRFKNLDIYNKTGVKPGDNFKVTASIPEVRGVLRAQSPSDADNSLFAKESDPEGGIARIACLRHLQNLDAQGGYNSGVVETIKTAEQTRDIFGEGNENRENNEETTKIYERIYKGYEFIPINNPNLTSYNGYYVDNSKAAQGNVELYGHEIRNLTVNTNNANSNNSFGLFSTTGEKGMEFSNLRLVNTVVDASVNTFASVGALAGTVYGTTTTIIDNCWVYWEVGEGVGSLQEELSTVENDGSISSYKYQLVGSTVGGLVGTFKTAEDDEANEDDEGPKITNSLSATMISGASAAGGLVGKVQRSADLTIESSYADCYLTGDAQVAGLVGDLSSLTKSVILKNCYSAGFIQIANKTGFKAAGLCLGNGKTDATNVYTAMRYINEDLQSINDSALTDDVYYLTENQINAAGDADSFDNTYYWGKEKNIFIGAIAADYDKMIYRGEGETEDADFAATMNNGSSFFRWDPATHAYYLRNDQDRTLKTYIFPGLVGLDHYGDWGQKFKDASLVYYEHYGDDDWGIYGGNISNLLSDSTLKLQSVLSDGYAVAFLEETLEGIDEINFSYKYFTNKDDNAIGNLSFSAKRDDWKETSWTDSEGTDQNGYLIPLPDELVYSSQANDDSFYHYLKIEVESIASGEYFFNPHFAEAIQLYNGTPDPNKWDEEMTGKANEFADDMGAVSIRTPRHLYDLSLFDEYYSSNYAFRQYLDLDYAAYNWMGMDKTGTQSIFYWTEGKTIMLTGDGMLPENTPYTQKPIGSQPQPFRGYYNGGYHLIKNVIPDMGEISAVNRYAGLFGNFRGTTLENIVYQMGPDGVDMDSAKIIDDSVYDNYRLYVEKSDIANGMYIGGLVGSNNGTINNCAVYGVDVKMTATSIPAYVGGLVGRNEGTIENCSAESNALTVNGSNSAHIYAGGFVGENYNNSSISFAYAVGRINGEVKNSDALLCGFAGKNSGSISNAYAAVDLEPSGGAKAYGFCDENGLQPGLQPENNIGYLDNENYTYRKGSYAANYANDSEKDIAFTYNELYDKLYGSYNSTKDSSSESKMGKAVTSVQKGVNDKAYPFPAVVRASEDTEDFIHYGLWVTRMNLGQMGVFYWEKLQDVTSIESDEGTTDEETTDEGTSYHIYALMVDPIGETITKQDTLSTAYDDGKAVTEYGYGYYYDDNIKEFGFNAKDIKYRDATGVLKEIASVNEENADIRNDKLKTLMGGNYTFCSWKSYYKGSLSQNVVAGLTPIVGENNGSPNDGTFTLTQTDESGNTTSVEFIINPHFAASISVNNVDGLPEDLKGVAPGITNENPYQVRSVRQLQNINWTIGDPTDTDRTTVDRTDVVLVDNVTISSFPYLNKHTLYWEQTHDLDWTAEGNSGYFTPIAGNAVSGKTLSGWFGGSYDGRSHTMKNFIIGKSKDNNEQDSYELNCIGLFGAVNGATLKDIVLYSEGSGTGILTIQGRTDESLVSQNPDGVYIHPGWWYAGGVLAGVAQDSTITGCAVAGYTIKDQTKYARDLPFTEKVSTGRLVWYVSISYTGVYFESVIYEAPDEDTLVDAAAGNKSRPTDDKDYYVKNNNGTIDDTSDDTWYYYRYRGASTQVNIYIRDDNGDIQNDYGKWRQIRSNQSPKVTVISNDPEEEKVEVNGYQMGGAIGGLVGMVSGDSEPNENSEADENNESKILSHCAAVVTIDLNGSNHTTGGKDAPIRVGGLVGSTTLDVENCYTGGRINYNDSNNGNDNVRYYIGRIIGGVGNEPFDEKYTGVSARVANCYSYMNIPKFTGNVIRALYNIGGTEAAGSIEAAGNTANLSDNNYYLINADGLNDESAGKGRAINYRQLAGEESILDLDVVYSSLEAFSPVTKSIGNFSVSGTFVSEPGLQGLDYPFPTILKRGENNVHYGAWDIYGIERYKNMTETTGTDNSVEIKFTGELGGSPVEMDLFTPKVGYQDDKGLHLEYLKLTDDVAPGGTWTVTSGVVDRVEVVQASFDGTEYTSYTLVPSDDNYNEVYTEVTTKGNDNSKWTTLYLRAVDLSSVPVTVNVKYTELGGKEHELNINVYVTASVDLKPSKLSMFPNDSVKVKLVPDVIGEGTLNLISVQSTSPNVVKPHIDADAEGNILVLDTDEFTWGRVYVDVKYEYTQNEITVEVEDPKRIEVTPLPIPQLWTINEETWKWTMDFSNVDIVVEPKPDVTAEPKLPDWLAKTFKIENGVVKGIVFEKNDSEGAGEQFLEEDVELTVTAFEKQPEGFVGDLKHKFTITMPKPVTEVDLPVEITRNESEDDNTWIISFGGYVVSDPKVESENVTVRVKLPDDESADDSANTLILEKNGEEFPDKVTLTVTLTKDNLKEIISLIIVLPEPAVNLKEMTNSEDDTTTYRLTIDLNDYKDVVNYVDVEVAEQGGFVKSVEAAEPEDFEFANLTATVSSGDEGGPVSPDDGSGYTYTFTYTGNGEDLPDSVDLTITLETIAGLKEKCTLTVKLPEPEPVASSTVMRSPRKTVSGGDAAEDIDDENGDVPDADTSIDTDPDVEESVVASESVLSQGQQRRDETGDANEQMSDGTGTPNEQKNDEIGNPNGQANDETGDSNEPGSDETEVLNEQASDETEDSNEPGSDGTEALNEQTSDETGDMNEQVSEETGDANKQVSDETGDSNEQASDENRASNADNDESGAGSSVTRDPALGPGDDKDPDEEETADTDSDSEAEDPGSEILAGQGQNDSDQDTPELSDDDLEFL